MQKLPSIKTVNSAERRELELQYVVVYTHCHSTIWTMRSWADPEGNRGPEPTHLENQKFAKGFLRTAGTDPLKKRLEDPLTEFLSSVEFVNCEMMVPPY